MSLAHIIVNTFFAVILSSLYLSTSRLAMWIDKNFRSFGTSSIIILIGSLICHVVLLVLIANDYDMEITVVASSLLFYGWAYLAYCDYQKYASVMDRPIIVSRNPLIYPSLAFLGFVSAFIAIKANVGLGEAFGLFVLWLVYGFIYAEMAIKKRMRRMKCDRRMATFAINNDRGKNLLFGGDKYPFP